ncbi:MAG: Zn-ribbon domain-containing OB-fold protein [bacterium]|nr:Zn-ribbon domain-containing OB-fold protein [bacterium]
MAKEIQYDAQAVDWETRAYWEGCGRNELVLQRCRDCATVQHRPRGLCVSCFSDEIEHFVASGRGTVYAFTVTNQNGLPAFRDACPYVLAYVALEEGPQLMTNIVGCDPEQVRIGMPVVVEFCDVDADPGEGTMAVPRFRPA